MWYISIVPVNILKWLELAALNSLYISGTPQNNYSSTLVWDHFMINYYIYRLVKGMK